MEALMIRRLHLDGLKLKVREKKESTVVIQCGTEDGEWVASCEEFNVHATAPTMMEVLNDVANGIVMVWREYAKAEGEELTLDAKSVKSRLCERFEVVE